MYTLYIANKNYSSWSLRPWLLMRVLGIPFEERLLRLQSYSESASFRKHTPSGKVPCLMDGEIAVWDSLSIVEYLAENHPGVWPFDPVARAWARSAAAEMHSGFAPLRQTCLMSCGVRLRLKNIPDAVKANLARIDQLWCEGLNLFQGPFLAGDRFTAVDAFYAPIVVRVHGYGLKLSEPAAAYGERILDLPAMKEWMEAAEKEDFREAGHEQAIMDNGVVLEDRRTPAR